MKLGLIITLIAIVVSAAVWWFSDGRFVFFVLPLLLGPLIFRRRV